MPARWCIDCRAMYDRASAPGLRCPACQAVTTQRRNARPNTRSRGYGGQHQRVRDQLLARWRQGDPCVLCGRPMMDRRKIDLAHNENRSGWKGLSHAACNRATARKKP